MYIIFLPSWSSLDSNDQKLYMKLQLKFLLSPSRSSLDLNDQKSSRAQKQHTLKPFLFSILSIFNWAKYHQWQMIKANLIPRKQKIVLI